VLSRFNPFPAVIEACLRAVPAFVGTRARTRAMRLAGYQIGHASLFWGPPTVVGPPDRRSKLHIGDHSGFNVRCFFDLAEHVHIGNNVSVGHEVMFLTRNTEPGAGTAAPIVVHDGAWLGARATILPGVTIGAGAVVGASVVVSEDVPEHTLFVGNQRISLARWR
jgi:acetyltransferase-like isoleucine patch superfamily enzyme